MRRFASLVLGGALVLGGLVACDDGDGNVTCDSNGDCDDGQACIGGQCQGLDTLDQDFDGDGLSNETEGQIGTDPRLVDTDGDGEDDRTEIGPGDEPLDTDGDGIIDALESDVLDSDGDGISDEQDPCNDDPTCPTPPVERCNGVDDDRDDVVDEDFELGAGCTVGIGACAREGVRVCDESGEAIRCDVNPGTPVDETCNGADDDCDGQTDEGVLNACGGCGEVAPDLCDGVDNDCDPSTVDGSAEPWFDTDCDGDDADLCAEGVEVCRDGARVCTDATDDARDLCNGEDDDCDPSTPDGAHEDALGQACDGPDADRCAEGVMACTDGALACDDATGDDLDVCDGVDNDCDPATPDGADEPWLGVACDGDDQDRCEEGMLGCVEGAQACSDATGDTPDVCDGVDNDCDPTTADGSAEPWFEGACDGNDPDACTDGVDRCTDGRRVCDDGPEAAAEQCNGEDDDCDGATDEDFADLGQGCAVGVGACAAQGRFVCAADGAGTVCDAEAGAAGEEICNGQDDDCDGTVDEGDPGGGAACDTGRPGRCGGGVEMCRDGAIACVGAEGPRDEICDGVDDDCDGQIDETFRVGLACRDGVGACAADGVTVCTADGGDVTCAAEVGAPGVEICNGLDDDCDGTIDEDATDAGGACSEGVGACAADGQTVCFGGALRCDAAPGAPQAETCNGVDDDCDGVVDDDPVEAGERCVGGVGVCAVVGVVACVDGAPRCDAEPGAPGAEICNGRDDDCDGTTDEDAADVGEPCVDGVGACAAQGQLDCVAGAMVCDAEPGAPGVEVCNGLDDDCDGQTDDEPTDAGGACSAGVGQCARDGAEVCVGGGLRCDAVAGEPVGETCNGLDDDCDGAIDDEPLDAGDPCLAGTGACTARGVRVCADGALTCDAVAGEPAPELCNGADDDCDGTIDEDPTDAGGDCAVGVGACLANGVLACTGGRLACDAEPGLPSAELCNGIDDDCDGDVDDAPQDAGQRCTVGQGECGSAGVLRCEGGGLSCDAQPGAPGPEVCDGRDNDCDGTTDEEPEDEGAPCTVGIGECAAQGVTQCVFGEATCTAEPGQPAEELCNGLDDDCDGLIDDQPTDAGGDCSDGVGACVRGGVERCVDGDLSCDAQAGPPGIEICNGIDDDCDGLIDNQPADAGGACAAGVGACRVAGVEVCVDGGLACGAVAGAPGVELCNGVDDDCDGVVDDQPTDVGQGCADGVGACAQQGVVRCVGGAPACDAVAGQPSPELCNGVDDDCDGQIDDQPTDAGRGCADGVGACLVRGVEQCVDGALSCDAVAGAPSLELCNGIDDDCDGQVDDDPNDAGAACADGEGACRAVGTVQCVDGALACDAVAGLGQPEVCNGVDDDCDGAVDDAPTDVGGDCAVGEGACLAQGSEICIGGALACDAAPGQPAAEVCNGIDDDCDGQIDDAPTDAGGGCGAGVGACAARGTLQCVDGGLSCDAQPGQPAAETCNGVDDDCDGQIDDAPSDAGAACTVGEGACQAAGVIVCGEGDLFCDAVAGQPGLERCNGIDDDCDGTIDEDALDAGGACQAGVGVCLARGVEQCVDGALACDAQPGQPQPEVCNDLDDDCDGQIDDDIAGVGDACQNGTGACQADGQVVCQQGEQFCDAQPGQPGIERCNGVDDDCDGQVDDDPQDVGGACSDGQGACQVNGTIQCVDGAPACDAVAGQQQPETCNGIDDDCDGTVDEDAPGVGVACQNGTGACQADGQTVCQGGALRCDAVAGQPGIERCNGIDDNCDGTIDDDPADAGGDCTAGLGLCQTGGVVQCVEGELACDAVAGQPQPETCNGEDDDCDGAVDNDVPGVGDACQNGTGACLAGGTVVCQDGEQFCDAVAGQPGIERCNGIDDDCDGQVDDAPVDAGGACQAGVGVCLANGVEQCVNGALACDAQPGQPQPEVCNDLDDDCDGQIDDDIAGVGDACQNGTGACQADGQVVCQQGEQFCDAQPGQPGIERCNGVDDDCDGQVDDDPQDVGGACSDGQGACQVNGTIQCVDGAPACDAVAGQQQPETCNGIDDDCDGTVDEDAPGVGVACQNGTGACQADGQTVCQGGQLLCDAVAGQPVAERCNGIDDNCDGTIDDAPVDAGGDCTAGLGLCQTGGVVQCVEGELACDAVAGQPQPETCNGEDDDCDGAVDNAVPGVGDACQNGTGACLAGGTVVCQDGEQFCDAQPGQPGIERCNGIDDDCDGQVDDAPVDAGGACQAGVGVCLANGVEQCVNGALACDAQPGQPQPEVCNNLDDDCDGAVDDNVPGVGVACQNGTGACQAAGQVVCQGGEQFCDAQPGQPAAERCNGVDDDCDGQIDDAPVDAGGLCTAGVGACFARGVEQCVNGALACDAQPGQPQPEVCNDVDDDCDGAVDDNVPGVGANCRNGTGECQAAGQVVCEGGEQFCDAQPGQPSPELCNGLDDDCDGQIDDAPTDVGGRCAAGVGICRALGTVQCGEGSPFCDAQPGQPRPETCNNLDDDCDGAVDDNVPGVGAGCQNGLGECVADGQVVCEGGEQFCDAVPGDPGPEFCNGLDDDCDGQVDDAPVDEGANCTVGVGGCQGRGQEVCVEGDLSCDAQPGQPQRERCNVVDDDCDGQTDEDFPIGDVCSVGTGACERDGAFVCIAGGLGCSAQPGQPGVEVCNGVDDDCNGEIDDALCCDAPPARVNVAAGGDTLDLAVEVAAHPNTGDGERVGVLYLTQDPDGQAVSLRRYAPNGSPVGTEHSFGLLSNPQFADDGRLMDLVAVDGTPVQGAGRIPVFVAAWTERPDQQNAVTTLSLVRANESGTQIAGSASLPVGQEGLSVRSPALVRLEDNIFAAAWYDEGAGQVRGQAYQVQYIAVGAGYFGGFVAVSNIVSLSGRLISVDTVRLAADDNGTVVAVWDERQELSTEIGGATWRPLDNQADQPTRLVVAGQNGAPAEGCRTPDVAWNPLTGGWMVVCHGHDGDAAEAIGLPVVAGPLLAAGPVVGLSEAASRSGPPAVVTRDDGFLALYAQTNPGAASGPVHLWSTPVFDGEPRRAQMWTEDDDGTDSTRAAPGGVELENAGEVFVGFTGGIPGPPTDTNTFRQRDLCLCNGEACDTGLAGRCAFGVTACDEVGTCEPIQRARQEACGNGDEDCDGQVDEGLCCVDDGFALRLNQTTSAISSDHRVLEVASTDPVDRRTAPRHGAAYLLSGRLGNGVGVRVFDGAGRPFGIGAAVGNSADNVFTTTSLRQLSIAGVNAPGVAPEFQVFVAFWLEQVPDSNSFGLWYAAVNAETGALLTTGTVQDAQGLRLRDVSEPAVARVGTDHLVLVYRETNGQQVQGRLLKVASATVDATTVVTLQDVAGARTLSGGQGFSVGPTIASNGTDVLVAYSGQVNQGYETFTVLWPDPVAGNGSQAARQVSGAGNGPPSTCFVPDVTWHGVSGRGLRPSIVCVEPGGQGGVTGAVWWSELDDRGAPIAAEKLADLGQNPRITGGGEGAQALWDQNEVDASGANVRQPFTAWIPDGSRPGPAGRLLADPPFNASYAYDADATFGPAGPTVVYHGAANNDTNPDAFASSEVCGP